MAIGKSQAIGDSEIKWNVSMFPIMGVVEPGKVDDRLPVVLNIWMENYGDTLFRFPTNIIAQYVRKKDNRIVVELTWDLNRSKNLVIVYPESYLNIVDVRSKEMAGLVVKLDLSKEQFNQSNAIVIIINVTEAFSGRYNVPVISDMRLEVKTNPKGL